MDWSQSQIPPMRLEARFGDRVVPAFSDRPASVWAMIAEARDRNADGEALICANVRLSWQQAVEQSARIAAGFRRLGLQRGDRVAILLGNRIEFPLLLFAAAHEGLVTVLLNDGRLIKSAPTAEIIADHDLMASCSLVPPQITRLGLALTEQGLRPEMTVEAMVAQVRSWLDGSKGAR